MKDPVIKTKRLLIKPVTDAELEARRDNETDEHMKEALGEMLCGCQNDAENRLWYTQWDIVLRSDGKTAGSLCFMGPARENEAEIGMGVDEEYRRQGIASEAIKAVMDWAFSQSSDLLFIMAETTDDNDACLGLLEKLGFASAGEGEEGPRFEKERPEENWMTICMCLGLCFGTLFEEMGVGIAVGMCLGLAVGSAIDAANNKKRAAVKELRREKRK